MRSRHAHRPNTVALAHDAPPARARRVAATSPPATVKEGQRLRHADSPEAVVSVWTVRLERERRGEKRQRKILTPLSFSSLSTGRRCGRRLRPRLRVHRRRHRRQRAARSGRPGGGEGGGPPLWGEHGVRARRRGTGSAGRGALKKKGVRCIIFRVFVSTHKSSPFVPPPNHTPRRSPPSWARPPRSRAPTLSQAPTPSPPPCSAPCAPATNCWRRREHHTTRWRK